MKIYFAENLRFLRHKSKLTQSQLAEKLGITRSRIDSYESKRSQPKLEDIVIMAKEFNVTLCDFVKKDLSK